MPTLAFLSKKESPSAEHNVAKLKEIKSILGQKKNRISKIAFGARMISRLYFFNFAAKYPATEGDPAYPIVKICLS